MLVVKKDMKKAEITNTHGYTKERLKKAKSEFREVKKAEIKITVIMLCMDGYGVNQIEKMLNMGDRTVSKYINNFNEGGLEKLLEYKTSSGRKSRMSQQEIEFVEDALESTPKEMNCGNSVNWTLKNVQTLIKNEFNKKYCIAGIRKILIKREYAFNRPTYVLAKASKKNR
jgi:transposase